MGTGNGERETGNGDVGQGTSDATVGRDDPIAPYAFVNPKVADLYMNRKWQLDEGLRKIFKAANITMSIRVEGRCRKTVVASFHSLRHTFVSLSANAGVPLPVVQSIVGHCSTAMTRHYYHENLDALRSAVASIPVIGERGMGNGERNGAKAARTPVVGLPVGGADISAPTPQKRREGVPARLKRLGKYLAQGLVTEAEYATARQRILSEV